MTNRQKLRRRVVLPMASSTRRLLAGLVDVLLPLGVAWLLLYTGSIELSVLSPDDPAFFPEHLADTYNQTPMAFLTPLWGLGLLCVLFQAMMLAAFRRSPGKFLLGLELVGPDGSFPDAARLALRVVGYAFSVLSLGLGWGLAFVTSSRRSLHDLSSDTFIIHRGAEAGPASSTHQDKST